MIHSFSDSLNTLIDAALTRTPQSKRNYLGASRLGSPCSRMLQYELMHTPKDQPFSGKILRIFAAGHVFEELAISWLRKAGFELWTHQHNTGKPFGFAVAEGRIKGHVDGIIKNAPPDLKLTFPMLWECKSLNAQSWQDTMKRGVSISKPVYAAQMALYQAYMENSIPGISKTPALFTAINKNTAELYHELVPFDGGLAQEMSDRGVNILQATESGEMLPRIATTSSYFECKFCSYHTTCWETNQ